MAANAAKDAANAAKDAAEDARGAVSRFFHNLTGSDTTKEILIGAGAGFATGFLSVKAGKTVAISVGGGIILLQLANDQGIIKVNYNKMNRKIDKIADKVEQAITGRSPSWTDKVVNFTKRNTPFTVGFVGGLLIGVGVSA
ncbi:FUN14 domain-containing protein 2-like [Euwallacea fornicatus]|uniref:FUN14 domain-containing protein 2-like n=1 Tax=Euwallacea fornicatus TaxID=995702 RepID=UPI00338F56A7